MSRTKTYTVEGLDLSANGIALAQAPTAATPLTLTAGAASLSPVRFVTLTSTANLSAITFTIVGVDRWNNVITELRTGPNNNTVSTDTAFASVTSITPSATSASTVSAGWPIGGVTPWVLCGRGLGQDIVPEVSISVLATVGVADGEVDATFDMFPRLAEQDIDVDYLIAVTPGTPVRTQASGVRFRLTTGAGTTAKVKFLRPGPAGG